LAVEIVLTVEVILAVEVVLAVKVILAVEVDTLVVEVVLAVGVADVVDKRLVNVDVVWLGVALKRLVGFVIEAVMTGAFEFLSEVTSLV